MINKSSKAHQITQIHSTSLKNMKVLLIFAAIYTTSNCFASDTAIHTYGGGPLLEKVFNAIAMVIYGNPESGIGMAFNGILRLAMLIGGFSAICLAFFR